MFVLTIPFAPLGIGILLETRVLRDAAPPRLIPVWELRLVSLSVSQMASHLVVLSTIGLSRYGSKLHFGVLPKHTGPLGLDDMDYCSHVENMQLHAGFCPGPVIPGRQPRISDLVPDRVFSRI